MVAAIEMRAALINSYVGDACEKNKNATHAIAEVPSMIVNQCRMM